MKRRTVKKARRRWMEAEVKRFFKRHDTVKESHYDTQSQYHWLRYIKLRDKWRTKFGNTSGLIK